ncbi:MAG: hypothetical protein JO109_08120 [Alphaproteobacteria bacterium]|nr:hypothetical protein [Alphaproteobacteria bacterium]
MPRLYRRDAFTLRDAVQGVLITGGPAPVDEWLRPGACLGPQRLWEQVQLQLDVRGTTQPQYQRRPKHLLSGLGPCGLCGSGWIKIRNEFWGCAGAKNGHGCSNTRIISDERYEAREDAIPRIRALIESIVLTPAATGRSVDIEIGGRLATMIDRPARWDQGGLTLERVKGIEPSS